MGAVVSEGSYTIGGKGTGADYLNFQDAASNISLPLTGDLTFTTIAPTTTSSPAVITGDLGGFRLRFTGLVPPRGRPGATYSTLFDSGPMFQCTLENGTLEIDNLEISARYDGWKRAIQVLHNPGSGREFNFDLHDVLITRGYNDKSISDVSGTNSAIYISTNGSVGDTVNVRLWNVIGNVKANDLGTGQAPQVLDIFMPPGFNASRVTVENCTFFMWGTNPNMIAVRGIDWDGTLALSNVIAMTLSGAPVSEIGFSLSPGNHTIQRYCVSRDASAASAGTVISPYVGQNPGNVFWGTAINESSFGLFMVTVTTGVAEAGGGVPLIEENTAGIQGRARPHGASPVYSVGAVEGAKLPIYEGSYTIGGGGDFIDVADAMSVVQPYLISGDITFTLISNVREVVYLMVDSSWPAIYLDGHKFRLTGSVPHNGDPQGGICWTNAVQDKQYTGDMYFETGDVEIDNLVIRYEREQNFDGVSIWHWGTGGTSQCHDLMVFGPTNGDYVVKGFMYDIDGSIHLDMWNVIVHGNHAPNPSLGILVENNTGSARITVWSSSATALIENCTFSAHADHTIAPYGMGALWIDANGPAADSFKIRNCLAISTLDGAGISLAFWSGVSGTVHYTTGYNCGSNDGTAATFADCYNPYTDVPLSSIISYSELSSQFIYVPTADSVLGNGATPEIPQNTQDIRTVPRGGTGIGSTEPLPPHTGDSPFVTNFQVQPVIEGPQILALWSLPDDSDTSDIIVLRKLLGYSETETDGIELINSPIGSAPNSYVDLNQTPQRAWCYTAFVRHYCTTYWTATELIEIETTIVPITTTGYFYVSRTRGLTGTTEPVWPTEIGDTVADGDVIWECFALNPSWVTTRRSRGAGFTWDSDYMQRLPWRTVPRIYRNEDKDSAQVALSIQSDPDDYDVWRAVHEDGSVKRGEFERFLLIFGAALSRVKGATDFYPKLVDPDECLPQYLPQLAGLVGWELSTQTPTAQQRQEILSAVPVYKVKGTTGSMEPMIRAATGVQNVVVDPMSHHILMSNRVNRLSARGVEGIAYPVWTVVAAVARGDIVIPTFANRTGYYYQVRVAGTTGASEPIWTTIPGDDVVDGTATWRCRQFGAPHLTANAAASATTISLDTTEEFEAGKTINIRDDTTPEGEEVVIDTVVDEHTLTLTAGLSNAYSLADNAEVTPAFDWHDDETGFIWDRPVIDEFDGIDPSRVRVVGEVIEPSELYSFEFLRIWFILQSGESVSVIELDRLAKIMEQFSPTDTEYVVRIEEA